MQRVEVVENLYQEQVSQVLTVKVYIRAKTVFMVFILMCCNKYCRLLACGMSTLT